VSRVFGSDGEKIVAIVLILILMKRDLL